MKKIIFILFAFASLNSHAQFGDFLKNLGKEMESKLLQDMPKIDKIEGLQENPNNNNNLDVDKNINSRGRKIYTDMATQDEMYGDFTGSSIDEAKINYIDTPSTASIKGEFDLKGLTIGMKYEEAIEKIRSSLIDQSKPHSAYLPGCKRNNSTLERNVINSATYPLGDSIIVCGNSFIFFGSKMLYSNFVFSAKDGSDQPVLTQIKVGPISSQRSSKNPDADLINALTSKFGIKPELITTTISVQARMGRKNENIQRENFIWTDEFLSLYSVEVVEPLQHRIEADYHVTLSEKDFYSTAEKRKKIIKEYQLDAAKKSIQRRAKDL